MLFIKHQNITASEKMLTTARKHGYTVNFTAADAESHFKQYYPGETLLFFFNHGRIKWITEGYKNAIPEFERVPVLTIK